MLTQGYSFTDLDGIRVQLIEGWWLLRASHTQDVLVARCESYTKAGLERVKQHLKDELTIEHVLKAGASTCEFEQKIHLFSGKLHILV